MSEQQMGNLPCDSPLQALHHLGQSPWLDFIDRDLIGSGRLADLVEQGIRGVTSNPAIFERAIAHHKDYDEEIERRARTGESANAIYEVLTLGDVRDAADILGEVYQESECADGFVSLEVSPRLAHDTERTIAEARRLWKAFDRPNAMIKVPATREGLPAIRALLADGVNVNVTLLFSVERYREVGNAWLAGLEERVRAGAPLDSVASVASFFLSRIDALVDAKLDEIAATGGARAEETRQLRGEVAIASARHAYQAFEDQLASNRFRKLAARGARPQRLLWASTGTKDPAYPETKYIDALVGPHTVTTMPLATLEIWRARGRAQPERVREDREGAMRTLRRVAALVPVSEIVMQLESEGVRKFVEPFDALHATIERKRQAVAAAHPLDGPA